MFYVDNIVEYWSASSLVFTVSIIGYLLFDLVVLHFPRKLALVVMGIITLILVWNIFRYTFLISTCKEILLPWGIFGEYISHCTIKRLIFQTIVSLMVPAAIKVLIGRTDILFFCNVNIYRSTGTVDRHDLNKKYVSSMKMEKDSSMKVKRDHGISTENSTIEVEMT